MNGFFNELNIKEFYKTLFEYYEIEDEYKFFENENVNESFLDYLCKCRYSIERIDLEIEYLTSSTELSKCNGSHYTPEDIFSVFDMITYNNMSILEPACGAGQFIISIIENNTSEYKINFTCIDKSIYAILCTYFRLSLKSYINDELYTFKFIEIDFLDFKSSRKYDCIVSNPPYIETRKKDIKEVFKYAKGNMYAYFIERSINLLKAGGDMYFIVPFSFLGTMRMEEIKYYFNESFSDTKYTNFADRPSSLFPKAHQRITIMRGIGRSKLGNKSSSISEYIHFFKNERELKIKNISYFPFDISHPFRFSDKIQVKIMSKLSSFEYKIPSNGKYCLYINGRLGFWMKIFREKKSSAYMEINFQNEDEYFFAFCFYNSSLFYMIWLLSSDCWHLTKKDINRIFFKTNYNYDLFKSLMLELEEDLERNKKYVNTKQVEYEYKHKYSKPIIDKIDDELGRYYNLTKEEVEYIKQFNIKYRMGGQK